MTRPCCVIPAALSFVGAGSASLGASVARYHVLFWFMSASLLPVSFVVNFRRDGGTFNKALTVTASVIAFIMASGLLEKL